MPGLDDASAQLVGRQDREDGECDHPQSQHLEPVMIEFKLPDMSCGHCAATVKRTVQALDAGAEVEVDLGTRTVRIDTQVDEPKLRAALTEEGYAPAA
jgi:copper chaperone